MTTTTPDRARYGRDFKNKSEGGTAAAAARPQNALPSPASAETALVNPPNHSLSADHSPDQASLPEIGRIRNSHSYHSSIRIPNPAKAYDHLLLSDKIGLFAKASDMIGLDWCVSVNLTGHHMAKAAAKGQTLIEWVRRRIGDVLTEVRRKTGHRLDYVAAVEPHVRLKDEDQAIAYSQDLDRKFGIHAAFKVDHLPGSTKVKEAVMAALRRQFAVDGEVKQLDEQPVDDERGGIAGWLLYMCKMSPLVGIGALPDLGLDPICASNGFRKQARGHLAGIVREIGEEDAVAAIRSYREDAASQRRIRAIERKLDARFRRMLAGDMVAE